MSSDSKNGASKIVSFDDESLILVDSNDHVLGHMPKAEAHRGDGILHRALSIFMFNSDGKLLLQQRAPGKKLWGGFWSNSVCSHPRSGETAAEAARRRLREEVGIDAEPAFLYKFEYHTHFGGVGAEHELCAVFAARSDDPVVVNPTEIADFAFIAPDALDRELARRPGRYSPWLKMEWPRIRAEHWDLVAQLAVDA